MSSPSMPAEVTTTGDAQPVTTTREIRLASRPVGEPTVANFELAEAELPALARGEVLVRNTWMSVDSYMRGRMDDVESYIPPFEIGAPLEASAVGEVVASRADAMPIGATVSHFLGWREHAVVNATEATVVDNRPGAPERLPRRAGYARPHRRRHGTGPVAAPRR